MRTRTHTERVTVCVCVCLCNRTKNNKSRQDARYAEGARGYAVAHPFLSGSVRCGAACVCMCVCAFFCWLCDPVLLCLARVSMSFVGATRARV